MKKLILCFLFSVSAFAADDEVRLSYQVSQSQEINQVVFFVKADQIKRWQNSNFFSPGTDVKLGEMKVIASENIKTAYARLKVILAHYEEQEQKLKKVNKTWNDLVSKAGPHATIVKINKYLIPEDSVYNKEVSELMQKLLGEKTSVTEGVELVKANKEIQYFKDSKVTKTESFLHPFYCERGEKTQLCHVKNWGSLRISL
jgi:hypothetical protein